MAQPILFESNAFPGWPIWGDSERAALGQALESGNWAGSRAAAITTFSRQFAEFQGVAHGALMANGSVTLEAALIAAGVGEGDEVIVPALTFVATAGAVLRVNATPVIVDIDPQTLCIDPARVEEAITERTRAVIAVHVAGMMADVDRLVPLCRSRSLTLIEDCAHAHGSAWRGVGAGAHGAFGSFSFQHSKLLSSGEGGALLSNDAALLERAWEFANCGRRAGFGTYFHATLASNHRMTEWQAAVLGAQLARYPQQLARRARAVELLDRLLAEIPGVTPQQRDRRMTRQGHYCYVFRLDPSRLGPGAPQRVFAALTDAGTPLSLSYPALSDLELFAKSSFAPSVRRKLDATRFDTPEARAASANSIWIHHRALLASDDVLERLGKLIARAASPRADDGAG